MNEHLREAAEALGLEFPHLETAAQVTEEKVLQAREALSDDLGALVEDAADLDVVVFGSMAREEMGEASDFDYVVIAHGSADPATSRRFREATERARVGISAGEPGRSGIFGVLIAAQTLVEHIGLQADTNLMQTRRVLLLEESVSLLRQDEHHGFRERILERYLHDYEDERPRVPRFLLNDLARYWRTVAVDYQAKRWDELNLEETNDELKWGVRYLKLRSSRKLTYASALIAIWWPLIADIPLRPAELNEQFEKPALARIAQLHAHAHTKRSHEALTETLALAERFNGWLTDKSFIKEMSAVTDPTEPLPDSPFGMAREATRDLQRSLQSLFFSDLPLQAPSEQRTLGDLSRKYLSF